MNAWPNFVKGAVIGMFNAANQYFAALNNTKYWEKLNSMLETKEQYEARTGQPYKEEYKWFDK